MLPSGKVFLQTRLNESPLTQSIKLTHAQNAYENHMLY
jgi:hypothetical protein